MNISELISELHERDLSMEVYVSLEGEDGELNEAPLSSVDVQFGRLFLNGEWEEK